MTEEERKARRREYDQRHYAANREKRCAQRRQYRAEHLEQEKATQRKYREANKDQVIAKQRQYYEENKDRLLEQKRQQYAANRVIYLERGRQWRLANKKRTQRYNQQYREQNRDHLIAQSRERYYADPARQLEYNRQWRARNIEKRRQQILVSNMRRRVLKSKAVTAGVPHPTAAAMTRRVWLFGNCCAYCGSDGPLHLDHVEPLARGGMHTPENLVPACQRCNLSKQAKPVETWYLQQPFFSAERWEALQAHTGRQWSGPKQLSLLDCLTA